MYVSTTDLLNAINIYVLFQLLNIYHLFNYINHFMNIYAQFPQKIKQIK